LGTASEQQLEEFDKENIGKFPEEEEESAQEEDKVKNPEEQKESNDKNETPNTDLTVKKPHAASFKELFNENEEEEEESNMESNRNNDEDTEMKDVEENPEFTEIMAPFMKDVEFIPSIESEAMGENEMMKMRLELM